jgi:hypothetical protein
MKFGNIDINSDQIKHIKKDMIGCAVVFAAVYCMACLVQGLPIFLLDMAIFIAVCFALRGVLYLIEKHMNGVAA